MQKITLFSQIDSTTGW